MSKEGAKTKKAKPVKKAAPQKKDTTKKATRPKPLKRYELSVRVKNQPVRPTEKHTKEGLSKSVVIESAETTVRETPVLRHGKRQSAMDNAAKDWLVGVIVGFFMIFIIGVWIVNLRMEFRREAQERAMADSNTEISKANADLRKSLSDLKSTFSEIKNLKNVLEEQATTSEDIISTTTTPTIATSSILVDLKAVLIGSSSATVATTTRKDQ